MSYKYIIFERNIRGVEVIADLVSSLGKEYELKGVATDIETARSLIRELEVDLILTDVKLKGGEVFSLFENGLPFNCKVIYFAATYRHTIQALRSNALDYIMKPCSRRKLLSALCRFESAIKDQHNEETGYGVLRNGIDKLHKVGRIGVATEKGFVMKNIEELVYVQAASNYSEYCFDQSEKHVVNRTLLDTEVLLNSYGFLRVHKSFLVNLSYLHFFDNERMSLHLTNGEVIPVAVRRKSYLLECLNGVL